MLRLTSVALAGLLLTGTAYPQDPQDSLEKTLLSEEIKILEVIKSKDQAALAKLLSDQEFAVTTLGGRLTGKQTVQSVAENDLKIESYNLSDVKLIRVSEDVAILSYRMTWTGGRSGKSVRSRAVYSTATWAKRDGAWKVVFYQDTPANAKPKGKNSDE